MVQVSESGVKALHRYFEDEEQSPLRITLEADEFGPSFVLVPDQPKRTDDVYTIDGITLIVNNNLHKRAGRFSIDYTETGFRNGLIISSDDPMSDTAGCDACCGC